MLEFLPVSRAITILGLVQVAMILLGFLALGVIIKIFGEHPDMVELSPLASVLRQYSMLLLALPVLWICYALWAAQVDRGVLSVRLSIVVGTLVAAAIPIAFLLAAAFPIKKWLI
ncbi:hypothetical protein BH09VER1_BH09VER1_38180 [soil metagenome]